MSIIKNNIKEEVLIASNKIISVSCMVYSRNLNKIAVIRRTTNPEYGKICFPGGKVRNEENYIEATKRELLEETGFLVKFHPIHLIDIVSYDKFLIIVTFAEIMGQNFAEEDQNVCWKTEEELKEINPREYTEGFINVLEKGFKLIKMTYKI